MGVRSCRLSLRSERWRHTGSFLGLALESDCHVARVCESGRGSLDEPDSGRPISLGVGACTSQVTKGPQLLGRVADRLRLAGIPL